jgi:cell cycle sensor histidine kinase DivJ
MQHATGAQHLVYANRRKDPHKPALAVSTRQGAIVLKLVLGAWVEVGTLVIAVPKLSFLYMRSPLSFGESKEVSPAIASANGRPEILRRKTLAANSRIAILLSLLALPFGVFALISGSVLPFLLATIGLAGGMATLSLHRRGQFCDAANGQVITMFLLGMVLAVADPAMVDFGLAIALLAPVHASLLGNATMKKRAWLLLVGVVLVAALGTLNLVTWPEVHTAGFDIGAGIVFAATAFVIAFSANRLNSAFEVYEKAQINAYRHLIEHVQDAVIRFSPEGEVLFASLSSETLFGCKRYELNSLGLIDRIHVLDKPIFMTAMADARNGGTTRSIELRMRRDEAGAVARAPQFVWVEVGLSPVIDPEHPSDQHEVVALFRDVTQRKDHESDMRLARKAAEDASEAKSRFLATIGHELRTPLNAIVGFSEMMASNIGGELSPTHVEYTGLIHQSGHHLLELVKMLLDMSKIEAGKYEIQADTFAPESLIEPCLQMVDAMAKKRQIRLEIDVARALPMITADERVCRQILINLLSNAVKFSNDGGVVTVSMKRQGQSLAMAVTDHGIGMGAEVMKRIGEPFFQAQDGLSRSYEGTGLGLSIVKGLVELHEGRLHTLSTPGEGTTMTVFLPINGPATKLDDTGTVTPLHRESVQLQPATWHDQKRSAR